MDFVDFDSERGFSFYVVVKSAFKATADVFYPTHL